MPAPAACTCRIPRRRHPLHCFTVSFTMRRHVALHRAHLIATAPSHFPAPLLDQACGNANLAEHPGTSLQSYDPFSSMAMFIATVPTYPNDLSPRAPARHHAQSPEATCNPHSLHPTADPWRDGGTHAFASAPCSPVAAPSRDRTSMRKPNPPMAAHHFLPHAFGAPPAEGGAAGRRNPNSGASSSSSTSP